MEQFRVSLDKMRRRRSYNNGQSGTPLCCKNAGKFNGVQAGPETVWPQMPPFVVAHILEEEK